MQGGIVVRAVSGVLGLLAAGCLGVPAVCGAADLAVRIPQGADRDWAWLDNGQVRLGVKLTSGAGIGWFSRAGGPNLINHIDHGRLVQQSYYGAPDGSDWAGKPWKWNPVQGGDYRGRAATVLELQRGRDELSATTRPRHWATGADIPEVVMQERIRLVGAVAHVRFTMTYSGTKAHPPTHQELPAVFIEPRYDTLVLYDGSAPWTDAPVRRLQPGFPNEGYAVTERWAAYVDRDDVGLGVYVPVADRITTYRYRGGSGTDCSYFAPILTFAITPGKRFEYDVYLAIGPLAEIRAAFARLHRERAGAPSP